MIRSASVLAVALLAVAALAQEVPPQSGGPVPAIEAGTPQAAAGGDDALVPTAQEEPQEPADAAQRDPLVVESMSDAEEDALRLVEEILREQQTILAGQNFVYRAEGRRDPFRNILSLRRRELIAPAERPPGLSGFLVSEVDATAAAFAQGRWHVLLRGIDQRTYMATVGTELFDGRIVEISLNEVVFEQEVEDLLGARSTRQFVKKINEDQ